MTPEQYSGLTPELRARFELTVKAGEEVVLPYTGVDYRLDLIDVVYFVNVRLSRAADTVTCHTVTRGAYGVDPTFALHRLDPLYIAAMERARA